MVLIGWDGTAEILMILCINKLNREYVRKSFLGINYSECNYWAISKLDLVLASLTYPFNKELWLHLVVNACYCHLLALGQMN